MPYDTKDGTGEDKGKKCVYKKGTDEKVGCTDGPIEDYLAALHANANESLHTDTGMQTLFENWRKFIKEQEEEPEKEYKKWQDYNASTGQWLDIPLEDIKKAAQAQGGEITIASELYDLIEKAYAEIGGHFDFTKPSDLPDDYTDWSAVELDGDAEPDALRVAKKGQGTGLKMAAAGHDGTRKAIDAYLARTADLLKSTGYYGEMSKGLAHVMIKYHNVPFVNNKEDVERVLGKTVEWVGAHPEGKYPNYTGWYVRMIGGKHRDMKILLGRPIGVQGVVDP